jgi:serine/threonine protein kinase
MADHPERVTLTTVDAGPDDVVVVPTRAPESHVSVVGLLASEGSPPPPAGPRYVEESELGRGGMGKVQSVLDRDLNRRVAKKTSQAGNKVPRRFVDEAQIGAQLEHPNILPVYDLGIDEDGRLFFTMKRVEDHASLRRVIERLRAGDAEAQALYTFERRVQIVQQVCLALSYAHARGVSHRDVKPENILVGPSGEVYLADWGIAGVRGGGEAGPHGASGDISSDDWAGPRTSRSFAGTIAYMSPERLTNTADRFDVPGDVYGLTAVLYELLTLTHYVSAGPTGDRDVMHDRVRNNRYVDAKLRADPAHGTVPPALSHVCRRGLIDRSIRDAAALHDALQRWLEGRAPVVCPRTAIQRALCSWNRFLDHHRLAGPALTFLLVAVVLFSIGFTIRALAR